MSRLAHLAAGAMRAATVLALMIAIAAAPARPALAQEEAPAADAEPKANAASDALLAAAKAEVADITTDALKAALAANPDTVVIDVRTVREANLTGGTIRAKRNHIIPRGWLEFRISDAVPDKSAPIVVFCGTNRRSPLAAQTLKRMGYTNIKNYAEGFPAWKAAGLPLERADVAELSFLYRMPEKVADGVWSAIGATQPSTYENAGHNNNLSIVVTGDGVVLVNAGGSWLLARAMHEEIKKITNQPVKFVILENGQGHAALGMTYWQDQGAKIIAHEDAAHEFAERGPDILAAAQRSLKDKSFLTKLGTPDITFADKHVIELGSERIEVLNMGPAHSPGDVVTWLPKRRIAISGDMAFHQRMLPVFDETQTGKWIESFKAFVALQPEIVIPGHGDPTTIAEVTTYTQGYLEHMRGEIAKLIDAGGTLIDAYKIDQSAYEHLDTYEFLARQNAGRIFRAMEFE